MAQNIVVIGIKYFFVDLIGGVLNFPLWWYTRGLQITARFCFGSIQNQWLALGLSVWLKNLFVPMYGETAISGRVISFFTRLAILFGKSVFLAIWSVFMVIGFAAYLILLPFLVINIVYHLAALL
jgi:hypothetical protein